MSPGVICSCVNEAFALVRGMTAQLKSSNDMRHVYAVGFKILDLGSIHTEFVGQSMNKSRSQIATCTDGGLTDAAHYIKQTQ